MHLQQNVDDGKRLQNNKDVAQTVDVISKSSREHPARAENKWWKANDKIKLKNF